MTKSKKEETKTEAELLWIEASKFLQNNKVTLPEDQKESFLKLAELTDNEQLELISTLSKNEKLPNIIRDFIELVQFKQAPFLSKVHEEISQKIDGYVDDLTLSALALTSKKVNTLFKTDRIFTKFLQQIVFGGQDKVEKLFNLLETQKRDKKIQKLLCTEGTVTDYSGRTFHCTAYEYAYWAKDTHMRKMLERYMNEDTKAEMLKRCEAIEEVGLTYTQHGQEVKGSKHFDLTPLETVLEDYFNGYQNWFITKNKDAMLNAWIKVGKAQRDLPAHIINEYCRLNCKFTQLTFNEINLPRSMTYYNVIKNKMDVFFPLEHSNSSGPGINFGLFRGKIVNYARGGAGKAPGLPYSAQDDLSAIKLLDEVRTGDLKLSLKSLAQKEQKLHLD